MNLLQRLARLFTAPARTSADNRYTLAVKCRRCGEVLQAHVNLANDLSAEYNQAGSLTGYVCRKVLVGQERCFQAIEIRLTFDANRKVIDRQIMGGTFVE